MLACSLLHTSMFGYALGPYCLLKTTTLAINVQDGNPRNRSLPTASPSRDPVWTQGYTYRPPRRDYSGIYINGNAVKAWLVTHVVVDKDINRCLQAPGRRVDVVRLGSSMPGLPAWF
ncbi:hypothetical protein GGS23DRAFT_144228 [Durotheca rogersii]|uniref:uncharacterized protein n=1 Tax=Durotheca rogersii TaxID=419775 RepID=UPI00221F4AAC|nr:uncharacterized protein GGS23DRAFT_144228 [Durotheca rogersii]KAI5861662.1 hypothetical protein GGS23DRAFT_144228 [Durotheca rogersii]